MSAEPAAPAPLSAARRAYLLSRTTLGRTALADQGAGAPPPPACAGPGNTAGFAAVADAPATTAVRRAERAYRFNKKGAVVGFHPFAAYFDEPAAFAGDDEGEWITIGGGPGDKGESHKGGFRVQVGKDGTIQKGMGAGKKVKELGRELSEKSKADKTDRAAGDKLAPHNLSGSASERGVEKAHNALERLGRDISASKLNNKSSAAGRVKKILDGVGDADAKRLAERHGLDTKGVSADAARKLLGDHYKDAQNDHLLGKGNPLEQSKSMRAVETARQQLAHLHDNLKGVAGKHGSAAVGSAVDHVLKGLSDNQAASLLRKLSPATRAKPAEVKAMLKGAFVAQARKHEDEVISRLEQTPGERRAAAPKDDKPADKAPEKKADKGDAVVVKEGKHPVPTVPSQPTAADHAKTIDIAKQMLKQPGEHGFDHLMAVSKRVGQLPKAKLHELAAAVGVKVGAKVPTTQVASAVTTKLQNSLKKAGGK